MRVLWIVLAIVFIVLIIGGCTMFLEKRRPAVKNELCPLPKKGANKLSEREWKKRLTPQQYHILREKGTETAFTGMYQEQHEPGVYHCVACGAVLFKSEDKFDSGTGWPSFIRPAPDNNVGFRDDSSHGMVRTEAYCKVCGGHLGHVFNDGPAPTGQRFCINSAALEFKKK